MLWHAPRHYLTEPCNSNQPIGARSTEYHQSIDQSCEGGYYQAGNENRTSPGRGRHGMIYALWFNQPYLKRPAARYGSISDW